MDRRDDSTAAAPKGVLFCFGLGYSAGFLARRLAGEGWRVGGTSRNPAAVTDLPRVAFARDQPLDGATSHFGETTHLLMSIPPDAQGDPVADIYSGAIGRLPCLKWLGYLSTTGVYGDHGGGWVDETSELRPTGERGRRRVKAEAAWRDLEDRYGVPVHIFRLAGIYGPGRSAFDGLREGRAQRIDKPGQVFSRIHVADIVEVLLASMARPRPRAAYNVCDDDPAAPAAVIAFAAELLGLPVPPLVPFETAVLSEMARSFYDDNKRVANRRIKEELGVTLRYPSFRQGLPAILAEEGGTR